MAKVLFVVYVPSTEPETENNEDVDVGSGIDDIDELLAEVKDIGDDDKSKSGVAPDEKNHLQTTGDADEERDDMKDQESDSKTEEGVDTFVDDPSNNIFFKNEENKNEDCEETPLMTEPEPIVNEEEEFVSNPDDNECEKKEKKPAFVRLVSETSLVEKVKRVLDDLNVGGVQWNQTEHSVFVGMFVADYGTQCEDILRRLSMLQIGIIKDSSVSVFPASISSEEKWIEKEFEAEKMKEDELSERVRKFKDSIKSRLVVDQVVNAVENDAIFTFDYLMLIILASLVAMMGLLESSSVVLVASMLISPLMGPILAGVFGVVIRKQELIRLGLVNEIRGLFICVLIGFVIGFIPASLETGTSTWRSSTEWPTPEMSSRGALRALPVGILIAVPSGAGVALSILGGKVGSLVGVAISASLLPPAVNAGLLWANSIVSAMSSSSVHNPNTTASSDGFYTGHGLTCVSLLDNDYERQYSCSLATENAILGLISLLLTILNIVCIIFMGVIVLKIKEVVPIPQSFIPESENAFFCQDLKVARESNMTMKGQAAAAIRKDWLECYQEMKSECGKANDAVEEDEHELNDIINEVEGSPSVATIYNKMHIRPSRWSCVLDTPRSSYDKALKFDFSHPRSRTASPKEDEENGIELRRRKQPLTSGTGQAEENEEEKTDSVYFTVHRYIHPRDLLGGESYSLKSGKVLKTLKVPKASRFMVAKVEDPAEMAAASQVSELATISEVSQLPSEEQPLLNSESITKEE